MWTGEFSIPPMYETTSISGGGSQLSLPEGQKVEVLEGMVIRAEEAGTIVAETQGGAIEVCQGICGEIGPVEPPIEIPPGGQVDIVINGTPEGIREFTEFRVRKPFRMVFRGGDVTMRMPGGQPYQITNTPYNPSEPVGPSTEAPPDIESKPVVQDPVSQEAPKPVEQSPTPQEAPEPEVQPPSQPTEDELSSIKPGKTQYDPVTGEPPWLKHVPYHPPSNPNTDKIPTPVLKPVPQPDSPPHSSNPKSGEFEKPTLKPVDAPSKTPEKDTQRGKFEKPPLKPVDSPVQPPVKDPKAGKFEKPNLKPVDSPTKPPVKDPKAGKFEKPTLKPANPPPKQPTTKPQPGKFEKPTLKPASAKPPPSSPPSPDPASGKFSKPPLKPIDGPKKYDPFTGEPQSPPPSRRSDSEGKSVIRFQAWNETRDGAPPARVRAKPVMTLLEFVARVMRFQEREAEGEGRAAEAA